jgi:hypothetical protein
MAKITRMGAVVTVRMACEECIVQLKKEMKT